MARRIRRSEPLRRAAQKAADWIESRQSADGSIDRAGGIASIYKTTFALVAAGRLPAAWRLMDFVADHWMTEPGEFHINDESWLDKATAFYRNCYILKAALRLGRFDIASPAALDHLFRYQHRGGGFCPGLNRAGRHRVNSMHACMGGWLCLYATRLDRAVRAGDFLLNLIRKQPDMPNRFYFFTNTRTGRCITKFDPGTAVVHVADRKLPRQQFFQVGAIMGFLADLYRATGKAKYLRGAEKMFTVDQGMHPRSFEWPSKCKAGWGAALLYSVTGNRAHRRTAERVARTTMLRSQRRDGSWPDFQFPQRDDGTGFVISSMELTAEFTFELCEMAKAMAR